MWRDLESLTRVTQSDCCRLKRARCGANLPTYCDCHRATTRNVISNRIQWQSWEKHYFLILCLLVHDCPVPPQEQPQMPFLSFTPTHQQQWREVGEGECLSRSNKLQNLDLIPSEPRDSNIIQDWERMEVQKSFFIFQTPISNPSHQ